jgi:hypothetical protein
VTRSESELTSESMKTFGDFGTTPWMGDRLIARPPFTLDTEFVHDSESVPRCSSGPSPLDSTLCFLETKFLQ